MSGTPKRKQSVYFPEDMIAEIELEARRQDRTFSWIVQRSWLVARDEIRRYPSINDPEPPQGGSEKN